MSPNKEVPFVVSPSAELRANGLHSVFVAMAALWISAAETRVQDAVHVVDAIYIA